MIPKLMHQIWVGPLPPPLAWMSTWKEKHPGWKYRLWTNEDLQQHPWINFRHMKTYYNQGKFNGVADLMRYEILYDWGGVVIAADSICLNPIDELFQDNYPLYAINTGDYEGKKRKRFRDKGSMTPLYAAQPGHIFTMNLIQTLKRKKQLLGNPVNATGNRFMQYMVFNYKPPIKIWPMHYFISDHFNGWKYQGPDKVFARHFWGTTRGTYDKGL